MSFPVAIPPVNTAQALVVEVAFVVLETARPIPLVAEAVKVDVLSDGTLMLPQLTAPTTPTPPAKVAQPVVVDELTAVLDTTRFVPLVAVDDNTPGVDSEPQKTAPPMPTPWATATPPCCPRWA